MNKLTPNQIKDAVHKANLDQKEMFEKPRIAGMSPSLDPKERYLEIPCECGVEVPHTHGEGGLKDVQIIDSHGHSWDMKEHMNVHPCPHGCPHQHQPEHWHYKSMQSLLNSMQISRLEIINHSSNTDIPFGRSVSIWSDKVRFTLDVQDDGKSLKIFLDDK